MTQTQDETIDNYDVSASYGGDKFSLNLDNQHKTRTFPGNTGQKGTNFMERYVKRTQVRFTVPEFEP
jgi:hypothetical protein